MPRNMLRLRFLAACHQVRTARMVIPVALPPGRGETERTKPLPDRIVGLHEAQNWNRACCRQSRAPRTAASAARNDYVHALVAPDSAACVCHPLGGQAVTVSIRLATFRPSLQPRLLKPLLQSRRRHADMLRILGAGCQTRRSEPTGPLRLLCPRAASGQAAAALAEQRDELAAVAHSSTSVGAGEQRRSALRGRAPWRSRG